MRVKTLGSKYSCELERLFGLKNMVQKPATLDCQQKDTNTVNLHYLWIWGLNKHLLRSLETLNRKSSIKISPVLVKVIRPQQSQKQNWPLFLHNSGHLRFTQEQLPLKISSQSKITKYTRKWTANKKICQYMNGRIHF